MDVTIAIVVNQIYDIHHCCDCVANPENGAAGFLLDRAPLTMKVATAVLPGTRSPFTDPIRRLWTNEYL
jgi:hypothetical protein